MKPRGIECEYNKEKCFFDTNIEKTHIITPTTTIEIQNTVITNVYTKDGTAGPFPYYIKIEGNENIILAFKTNFIRDFYKSFYTIIIKENEENKNSLGLKTLQQEAEENLHYLDNVENTKMQMVKYTIEKPVLIDIFYEMNCTMTQFFNYIRQSFFFNIKNQKNVIDRLLNEKTREFSNYEDNFATRINTLSYIQLTNEHEIQYMEKEISQNEVDFVPILVENKDNTEDTFINDFTFPEFEELRINMEYKIESEAEKKVYNKKILEILVDLCKKMYHTNKHESKVVDEILQQASQFKNYIEDPNLQCFNPSFYIKKK